MLNAQEARQKIEDLLENRISLEDFEDWSASSSWNLHKGGDKDAQAIAYQIRSILNEHSNDATEYDLRQELAVAARPFALRRQKPIRWEYAECPREYRGQLAAAAVAAIVVLGVVQPGIVSYEPAFQATPGANCSVVMASGNAGATGVELPVGWFVQAES